jgi:hypothetical protein
MNAKNIKITVREGKVMLRGPIDSQREKDIIGTRAGQIAGTETPGFVYDRGSAEGCRGPSGDYQGKPAVTKAVFRPAAGRVHRFVF